MYANGVSPQAAMSCTPPLRIARQCGDTYSDDEWGDLYQALCMGQPLDAPEFLPAGGAHTQYVGAGYHVQVWTIARP
jgi:hypothetical protein